MIFFWKIVVANQMLPIFSVKLKCAVLVLVTFKKILVKSEKCSGILVSKSKNSVKIASKLKTVLAGNSNMLINFYCTCRCDWTVSGAHSTDVLTNSLLRWANSWSKSCLDSTVSIRITRRLIRPTLKWKNILYLFTT